jgi:hypothetical protein
MFRPTPQGISQSFHHQPVGRSRKVQSLHDVHAQAGCHHPEGWPPVCGEGRSPALGVYRVIFVTIHLKTLIFTKLTKLSVK